MKGLYKVMLVRAQKTGELCRKFDLLREYINNHTEDVDKKVDIKGSSGEVSAMRTMLIDNGKKVLLVFKVANYLAELCSYSSVLWKVEIVNNKIGYLAEEISKSSVGEVVWFLLTADSKM